MNEDIIELLKKTTKTTPYWNLLDMEVQDAKEGFSKCVMNIAPKHLIMRGTVHGGAIASLADSAVAVALIPMIDRNQYVATVELKVNYLGPVAKGKIIAEARIIHKGSRTAVGEVDITNNFKLVAKCIATYMILEKHE